MEYLIHTLAVVVGARRRERLSFDATVSQRFRVYPWHCDLNRHLNNGRYLTFMDYGRIAWLVRVGLWSGLGGGTRALVAGIGVTYRRELPVWSEFQLCTMLAGFDDRWLYVRQTFHRGDSLAAAGIVRVCLRGRAGLIPPEQLVGRAPGRLPPDIAAWRDGADGAYTALFSPREGGGGAQGHDLTNRARR